MADYDPSATGDYAPTNNDSEYQYQRTGAGDDEDDEYDPLAMESNDEAQPAATALPSQPKTVGGFVVDDDDEEDEEDAQQDAAIPPPSQLNGTAGAQSGLGAAALDNVIASEPSQEEAASAPSIAPAPVNGSSSHDLPAPLPNSSSSTISATAPAPSFQSPTDQGKQQTSTTASAMQSATATPQPQASAAAAVPPQSQQNGVVAPTPATQRLPHDKVGQLEDRIKEDPKADTEAWRELIKHYRDKGQLDNARKVYERFFEVFPNAASMWVEYAQMELDDNNYPHVEQIFQRCLMSLANLDMWSTYLDYARRMHPLMNDPDGSKRNIINSAFEILLEHVGIDPDAGRLWREYIEFHKGGPGTVGGTGWQDAQKVDLLRKAYQRAIRLPHSELVKLWKEYDNFEVGINKGGGRKFLAEQSPHYMTAKAAKTQLDHKIEGLDRNALPKLPPLYGFAGEDEFATQVEKWRGWIDWEKEDPLVLKDEDVAAYHSRIIYVYKQATMALRFYPTIWFDAASFCFEQGTEELEKQGEEFLDKGIEACPESVLLTLKKADRVESSLEKGNDDDVVIRNGEKLDAVFEQCHVALYALHKKIGERTTKEHARLQEYFNSLPPEEEPDEQMPEVGDEDDEEAQKPQTRAQQQEAQLKEVKATGQQQQDTVKRTISYLWVAKLRAFRRIQGQGQPGKAKKGFRGVFAEARPRGQLTSEVYIASALMEWRCYRDKSAEKIFERGMKLFPTDEVFALGYIKHLISNNDDTNARAVFETTLSKIINTTAADLEKQRTKCHPLMTFMHEYESNYGDLDRIHRLEARMRDMFPAEPEIQRFGNRFALPSFDAVAAQLVISPTQVQPKPIAQQEQLAVPVGVPGSPNSNIRLGPNGPYVASPKRPLDDSDSETPQRKFMRGESPLKGAAGRRLQNHSVSSVPGTASGGGGGFMTKNYVPPSAAGLATTAAPPTLPVELVQLLGQLPPARMYNLPVLDVGRVVGILAGIDLLGRRGYGG